MIATATQGTPIGKTRFVDHPDETRENRYVVAAAAVEGGSVILGYVQRASPTGKRWVYEDLSGERSGIEDSRTLAGAALRMQVRTGGHDA